MVPRWNARLLTAEMGSEADRAYYNLAGAYVSLSQTYPAGSDELAECLEDAGRIYTDCRQLAGSKVRGPGPPVPGCGHKRSGNRRLLSGASPSSTRPCGRRGPAGQYSVDSAAGNCQRADRRGRGGGPGDGDVRKSTTLLAKAAYLTLVLGYSNPSDGEHAVHDAFEEAREEFRSSYPSVGKSSLPGE